MRNLPTEVPRIKRHISEAFRQHIGGLAGVQGVRFQDLVAVEKLLECAAYDDGENPRLEQEMIDSWTDDLHVVYPLEDEDRPELRRHYQIKSVADLRWSRELTNQFLDEREEYPQAELYLHVHTERMAKKMAWGRHSRGLGFVRVNFTDLEWRKSPHLNLHYCMLMDRVSLMPAHRSLYAGIWNQVYSTWINQFGCHGDLYDVFAAVSEASLFTISCLRPTTPEMDALVFDLESEVEGLWFAADGDTLVVTSREGRLLVPLPVEWAAVDSNFWQSYPRNAWDFKTQIGAFTSPIGDDDEFR